MPYRIDSIEVYNFKLFEHPFTLPVERKNILLFGENGSGKSSIYWSFFTHYQAVYKPQDKARKYFLHNNKDSLRNKFSDENDHSWIKVTFKDENNSVLTVEDSDTNQSVASAPVKSMMIDTAASSDFFNYKSLSSIFDFSNSEDNELFVVFEKEVFQYLSLRTQLVVDEEKKGNDALTWWNYINSEYKNLPKNRKNYNDFNQNAPEYKAFTSLLNKFNEDTRFALTQLIISANQILHDVFSIPVELTVRYEGARFNERLLPASRSRDRKVSPPRIVLNAKMVHSDIANQEVKHPCSFFNEAKLTCMSLALRIAILNGKPSEGMSYASALFVDDLLISLDMSYRRKVVEVLLDVSENRQFLFFTHDRALYHLFKEELESRKKSNNWIFYELFTDYDSNGHPVPNLVKPLEPINEAKVFLHEHRIPACANAIRRACEKELRRLLPYNKQLKVDPQELSSTPLLDFNGLICKFEQIRKETGLPDIAHGISTDRKLVLNPFSHDDIETPFYHAELERLITCCERMGKIERKDIVGADMIHRETCKIVVSNAGHSAESTFVFHEGMTQYELEGQAYWTNPKVKVLTCAIDTRIEGKERDLSALYRILYNSVSLNATSCPPIKDVLFKADGTLLIN